MKHRFVLMFKSAKCGVPIYRPILGLYPKFETALSILREYETKHNRDARMVLVQVGTNPRYTPLNAWDMDGNLDDEFLKGYPKLWLEPDAINTLSYKERGPAW